MTTGIWVRTSGVSIANGSNALTAVTAVWNVYVRPADGASFDGGTKWYEIASVDANNAITLIDNFAETSIVNGSVIIDNRSYRHQIESDILETLRATLAGQTQVIETTGAPNPNVGADMSIAFDPNARVYYHKINGVWSGAISLGGADGVDAGFHFTIDTATTMADPGSGKLRFNNATPASITAIAIDDLSSDTGTPDVSSYVTQWAASSSGVKGVLIVRKLQSAAYRIFNLSGLTDNSGWTQLAVALVASNGSLAANDICSVSFIRTGDQGTPGADGANAGFLMTLDRASTTMADPGNGKIRFNNASFNSTTNIAIDDVSSDAGNPTISALIAAWASSTNAVKGRLEIRKFGAPQNFVVFNLTAVAGQSGWSQLTVASAVAGGTLMTGDVCVVTFAAAGDKGTDGADGLNPGFAFTFDTSTGMASPGDGKIRLNNAALASVTALAIADKSAATGNPDVSASILSWDDSSNANMRGTLRITKKGAEQVYAEYAITAGTVDNVGWSQIALSAISSAGSFANGDTVFVSVSRTGDKGLDGLGAGDVVGPAGASDGNLAAFDTSTGKRVKDSGVAISTDATFGANSDAILPTQKAVGSYVATAIAAQIAASDVEVLKGAIDCSGNPNYPAADAGHVYRVSVAGKIGGASGPAVEIGDRLECFVDSTPAGTHASVGSAWIISQVNIDGAVVGPASSTSGNFPTFNGSGGKVIQDSGKAPSTDGTFASNSDNKIPTEKAAKTYVDGSLARLRPILAANAAYYVGANIPTPSISIASPAVISSTAHGLQANDPVVFNVPQNTQAVTVTIASPGVFTLNSHGFAAGQPVKFNTTGALPTGLTDGTTYYVIATGLTTNTFQVSATVGGSAVNTSGTQSGTHYCSQTGSLPTGITEGTVYYVISAGLTTNAFEVSATLGGSAVNTSGTVTGSPVYKAYTGNDANSGKTQNRSGAFLTPQKALDTVSAIDLSIYNATIQLADGTYTGTVRASGGFVGSGSVYILGNTTTPSNVFLNVSGSAISAVGGAILNVGGMKISSTGIGLYATNGGTILFANAMAFGANSSYGMYADSGGKIRALSIAFAMSGGGFAGIGCQGFGLLDISGSALTLNGTPAFAAAFAAAAVDGLMIANGFSFSGSATGQRYSVSTGAGIFTNGGGASFFPGSSAGALTSPGWYN